MAGNGERGVPKDGAEAKFSPLIDPRAVTVDSKGNVYILERSGHALCVVDPSGKIKTVVGTGKPGAGGDGGPALKAEFAVRSISASMPMTTSSSRTRTIT